MTIDFTLTGDCLDEARSLLGTFCERELSLATVEGSEDPADLRGRAAKFFFLGCVVADGDARGKFLLDRVHGRRKVAGLLAGIKKIAAPADSVTLSVGGLDDLDLKVASPASVYAAIARGAKLSPPARTVIVSTEGPRSAPPCRRR